MKKAQADKLWALLMQNGRCILCGEAVFVDRSPHAYGGPTSEHKVPVSHGGAAWRRNRALSHAECNHQRSDRALLKCVRPPETPVTPETGRRPFVPMNGIWYSHFRLPVGDHRWDTAEQRERMLTRLSTTLYGDGNVDRD